MRPAGKSHPEWDYLTARSGALPAVRIALVAPVIGAIGGAVVVVSLIERPEANEDNTSIAAHALVAGAPVNTASPSSLTTATLLQSPVQPKPAASVGLLAPPATPASTTSPGTCPPRPDRTISPMPNTVVPVEIAPKAEATAATADARADVAPPIAPVEGRHHVRAKRWRHRRPRRLYSAYNGRGFGSVHDDW